MKKYKKIRTSYRWGERFLNNEYHLKVGELSSLETSKQPSRTEVINFLLQNSGSDKLRYIEIGVRNPEHNFNHITAAEKYSIDPGVEFKANPVDFKMTSDDFFSQLKNGTILNSKIKFDVIFIDGLHLADQVYRDIANALDYISDDGFIVLHDCNPPTEWHAREEYLYDLSPAKNFWNGTTWKAFYKYRFRKDLTSVCIDTDWGLGIITKRKLFNFLEHDINPFFEFNVLEKNRKEALNLITFDEFNEILEKEYDKQDKKKDF